MFLRYNAWFLAAVGAIALASVVLTELSVVFFVHLSHRVMSPRIVPEEVDRRAIVKRFIAGKSDSRANVLVVGDSQANGYEYPASQIFSARLGEVGGEGCKTLNLAFQDGRVLDIRDTAKLLTEARMKFDYAILNASQTHTVDPDFQWLGERSGDGSYYHGLLKSPVTYFRMVAREFTQRTPERPVVRSYPGYFGGAQLSKYISNIKEAIEELQKVSKHVVLYVTPYAPSIRERDNTSRRQLEQFTQGVLEACQEFDRLTCVDPDRFFLDSDFFDIVHLNSAGHKKMAWFLYTHAGVCRPHAS